MRVPPYSRYAAVYDHIGQRIFGERIADATLAWLGQHGVHPKRAADLACGTGAATFVLAHAGAETFGVDRSPEMLAVAQDAARSTGLSITWIEQDIRDLALPIRVDLVTAFFDSLNYLTDDNDLSTLFHRVAASLVPNGYFVFDLNTRHRLAEGWGNTSLIVADRVDLFGAYRSWFDPETDLSPLLLTFFVRQCDNGTGDLWERFDEEHVERAFDLETVRDDLETAGLHVEEMRTFYDGSGVLGGQGTEASERVVFFARRAAADPPDQALS